MAARSKKKRPWIVFIIAAVIIFCLTVGSILFIHPSYPSRIGVAIVGDPTIVFSYDPTRLSITGFRIPSEVSVDLTRGYGVYPISSVWKLDSMDKRKGLMYTETLEEVIGIPIRFYINPSGVTKSEDSIAVQIQQALSFSSTLRAFFSKDRTNMPLWLLFLLSRAMGEIHPTDAKYFDLQHEAVFSEVSLPDGTQVKKIDPGKLEFLLGTHAEDANIRKENLRIAVYNTTNTSGLAQKITRVMEESGFHVVTIANNESIRPDRCIVRGREEDQKTSSVKTLLWLYGCVFEKERDEQQTDLTLIVGSDFEKRFLPF